MNHYTLQAIGSDHELDLLKEAEHRQLVKLATAGQSSPIAHLLDTMGGLMIKIGEKLQKQPVSQITAPLGWAEE